MVDFFSWQRSFSFSFLEWVMSRRIKKSIRRNNSRRSRTFLWNRCGSGDLLFHGDGEMEKKLGVNLSKTGMACAMCHPFASDTHPHEFPKFQEQIQEFATLRDMINWCIENPNEGERIDVNGPAMKALETYHYWSNKGSVLDAGKH